MSVCSNEDPVRSKYKIKYLLKYNYLNEYFQRNLLTYLDKKTTKKKKESKSCNSRNQKEKKNKFMNQKLVC